jgi:hypothetical protein
VARSLLRIPRTEESALARLLGLSSEQHADLSRALRESGPCLSIKGLADRVAEKIPTLPKHELRDLVRVLATLYTVRDREQADPAAFLTDIERAAKETRRDELGDKVDWTIARTRLGELLSNNHSLGVTAKAVDVLREHERVFCDARILTDVRPVFAADVHQTPDATVLIHELRIAYHESGDLKAIYVAMDSSDVRSLRDALERAVAKEATLEKLSKVPMLRIDSHEE